jgi:hypothetical protein
MENLEVEKRLTPQPKSNIFESIYIPVTHTPIDNPGIKQHPEQKVLSLSFFSRQYLSFDIPPPIFFTIK